jgi:hypothetical protein
MADYTSAAVCRRGHPARIAIEYAEEPIAQRCDTCGAEVLTACPECGQRIRGGFVGVIGGGYIPPDFCDRCGAPFPWLSRQGLIYQLQDMLDEEKLDPATRLEVREQLDALTDPELDEKEQLRRWSRIKRQAPGLWEKTGAQRILVSVVSAAIKHQLGL